MHINHTCITKIAESLGIIQTKHLLNTSTNGVITTLSGSQFYSVTGLRDSFRGPLACISSTCGALEYFCTYQPESVSRLNLKMTNRNKILSLVGSSEILSLMFLSRCYCGMFRNSCTCLVTFTGNVLGSCHPSSDTGVKASHSKP